MTAMSKGSHIFSQILGYIDWNLFGTIVDKYAGDRAAKGITCRAQLVTMLFANIGGLESLREIVQGMEMQGGNLSHMGIDRIPKKSSLAYANDHRSWEIYRDFFEAMVERIQEGIDRKNKPRGFKGKLLSVDSTTIDLCLSLYPWARFHHRKGAVKIHTVLDHDGLIPVFAEVSEGRMHDSKAFRRMLDDNPGLFTEGCWVAMDRAYNDYATFNEMTEKGVWFVTRIKSNAVYQVVKARAVPQNSNIVSDEIIELTSSRGKACGYHLRKVVVNDATKGRKIELLTNNHAFGATTVAAMYKQRWQVELFFKQIKQNLKIKSFVGTSENAVKTQIYCALIAILLMNRLKAVSDSRRQACKQKSFSFSNMTAMLRMSLFRCCDLNSWLSNPFVPPPEWNPGCQLNMNLFGQHPPGTQEFTAKGEGMFF
jgi:hypothetical protein